VDCLFGYTGRAWDSASQTWRSDSRPYDPSTGSWIQKDLIGFNGKDTNTYRYCANSPTNATDPSGLAPGGIRFAVFDIGDQGSEERWPCMPYESTNLANGKDFLKDAIRVAKWAGAVNGDDALKQAVNAAKTVTGMGYHISMLFIFDHRANDTTLTGPPTRAQELGTKTINPNDPDWKALASYVDSDGVIVLTGCQVAGDFVYLRELAKTANRRVRACYEDVDGQMIMNGQGEWLEVDPNGHFKRVGPLDP
jgi:RHS repeat-associated protein